MGKKTGLSLKVTKEEDFSAWYREVIVKADMIDYYNVGGCYILKPNTIRIWEKIQEFFDGEIKKMGVEPCYFPMFVTKGNLQKEADHIEDFAPEVAWVTKSGDSEMQEPIAIRPTSETIMYPAFSKWVQSHRDLPLRLNQWTNVVRWEFKNPTPFIRTREFLWQEGHTAFATREEADKEVIDILDLYARVYEELLALPVIKGCKSTKEKFPGGDFTTTVEAFIPACGRAVQGGTSHSLGQNFSKMFDISYAASDELDGKAYAWQNSWGLSTRTIGALVMVHGDNTGLVLPPRVAPIQVVGVCVIKSSGMSELNEQLLQKMDDIITKVAALGIRTKNDTRDDKSFGWKFNFYEQRGVPLRIELGEKELQNGHCGLVRRDTGERTMVPFEEIPKYAEEMMKTIQADLLDKARKERDSRLSIAWTWEEFLEGLNKGNLVLAPWCLTSVSEEWVKEETKRLGEIASKELKEKKTKTQDGEEEKGEALTGAAKTLCIPFVQPPLPEGTKCFTGNGEEARQWCLWGRSF